jgi:hypothetical protein
MVNKRPNPIISWIDRNAASFKVWAAVIFLLSWAISNTLGQRVISLQSTLKELKDDGQRRANLKELREKLASRTDRLSLQMPTLPPLTDDVPERLRAEMIARSAYRRTSTTRMRLNHLPNLANIAREQKELAGIVSGVYEATLDKYIADIELLTKSDETHLRAVSAVLDRYKSVSTLKEAEELVKIADQEVQRDSQAEARWYEIASGLASLSQEIENQAEIRYAFLRELSERINNCALILYFLASIFAVYGEYHEQRTKRIAAKLAQNSNGAENGAGGFLVSPKVESGGPLADAVAEKDSFLFRSATLTEQSGFPTETSLALPLPSNDSVTFNDFRIDTRARPLSRKYL